MHENVKMLKKLAKQVKTCNVETLVMLLITFLTDQMTDTLIIEPRSHWFSLRFKRKEAFTFKNYQTHNGNQYVVTKSAKRPDDRGETAKRAQTMLTKKN